MNARRAILMTLVAGTALVSASAAFAQVYVAPQPTYEAPAPGVAITLGGTATATGTATAIGSTTNGGTVIRTSVARGASASTSITNTDNPRYAMWRVCSRRAIGEAISMIQI